MYKLLRRISSSFKGRFDWKDEDRAKDSGGEASSTTPQTGSKRRMSEDDDVPNGSLSKRSRGHASAPDENDDYNDESREESEAATPAQEGESQPSSTAGSPRKETEGVRQVRKGVKELELENRKEKGKEKEVVGEHASEKEEDGQSDNASDAKDEGTPGESAKSVETPGDGVSNVAAESASDDAKEGPKVDSEPSQDASSPKATTLADIPEASEPQTSQIESAYTSTVEEKSPESNSVPISIPPVDDSTETPSHTPAVVPEPLIKLSSDEVPIKVQG